MAKTTEIRLAIDIGGTFTDVVLDGPFGRVTRKVLTTVAQPEVGLMNGAKQLLQTVDLDLSKVDVFVHGTTLATNAVLERKGAKTALIATAGFRDVLELGSEGRYDQYDLQISKPQPLIPRERRYTVSERMDATGNVKLGLSLPELAKIAQEMKATGVESVAIAFMHSYANPEHEETAAKFIEDALPGVSVTMSSDVCPEIREFERTSTAAGNAYVKPLINGYLERMEAALAAAAFTGRLFLVTSGGGLTSIETARRYPIRLVESGPAGGAIYAAQRARSLGDKRVVSFDMGGTTAKVCLIQDGEPITANSFEVDRTHRFMKGSGLPLRIPAVELVEIGAGGGSIAGVDKLRRVTVGPESAGSQPGPACYPNGGAGATVTDADLALGLLDPAAFAGGRVALSSDAAGRALDAAVGKELGLSTKTAAFAVTETVCESMASAVRAVALSTAGAHVTLVSRTAKELDNAVEAIKLVGGTAEALTIDVTDIDQLTRVIEAQPVHDILVNNAGMNRPKPMIELTVDDYDAVMGLNVKAAFFAARLFAQRLISADRPGSIINVSSQMGHVGAANRTLYCTSKWAIEGMTRAMAVEFGPRGIRVNTICPTFVETPMTREFLSDVDFRRQVLEKIKLKRLGRVDDVMGGFVFLASDASSLMTGSSLMLDGGWTAE